MLALSGCGQVQIDFSSNDADDGISRRRRQPPWARAQHQRAEPPNYSNAGATWADYTRAEVYPGVVTLPLQFITLTTGERLAVLVSVPADANGKPWPARFPRS